MYSYAGAVLAVTDGDTVHAELQLGLDVSVKTILRLYGINAPEMKTPEGPPARQHLIDLLAANPGPLVVNTVKDHTEKYGRYLATLVANGVNLNAQMVADGFAVPYLP
jgi:micrococcal nuclease